MNKTAIKKTAILAMLAVTLGSCNIYKKYELPQDNAFVADYRKSVEAQADSTSLPFLGWEEVFTDAKLQTLIRLALANNQDLENARLNIDIAKAQLKGAKLSYFPSLALNPNGGTASYGGSHMNWSYTIPAAISWEIDAFGRITNRKLAAKVAVEQMEDYEQAARSQIICGVASTYYALMLLNQQYDLTVRTSEIWKDQVESMELMKEAGRMNEAAVVQSRANYYSILATIPDLENQIKQTQNALSVLLGAYPQVWEIGTDMNFDLPANLKEGVPMSYLAVRPDVRAAERSLASAYYATQAARANFYPNLTISAQGGFTNLLGSMIANPGKWFIQLAGQLAAPIFSRGANIENLEASKARQEQAMNSFESTVLKASSDVSDALTAIRTNAEKREFILKQIDQLEKSVEYTQELLMYNTGTTYLELLTARSSLLNAQLSSLACWHSKVAAIISLYQAVGGGR